MARNRRIVDRHNRAPVCAEMDARSHQQAPSTGNGAPSPSASRERLRTCTWRFHLKLAGVANRAVFERVGFCSAAESPRRNSCG